jgi:hypothetical protein
LKSGLRPKPENEITQSVDSIHKIPASNILNIKFEIFDPYYIRKLVKRKPKLKNVEIPAHSSLQLLIMKEIQIQSFK